MHLGSRFSALGLACLAVVLAASAAVSAAEQPNESSPLLPECSIEGTDGPDFIVGTDGDDVLCGFGGDDIIFALGGDDVIVAGNGDDLVSPGAGNDSVDLGEGTDTVVEVSNEENDFVSAPEVCDEQSAKFLQCEVTELDVDELVEIRQATPHNVPGLEIPTVEPPAPVVPKRSDVQDEAEREFRDHFGLPSSDRDLDMAREDPSEVSLRAFGVPLSEGELQVVQAKEQQREHAELYMDQLERSLDVASFWFDYSSERLTLVVNALDVESVSRIVSDERFNVEVREVPGSVQELMDSAQQALSKGEAIGDEIGASDVSLSYDARNHSITVDFEVPSNEIAERARTIGEIDGFVVEANVSIKFSTCANGRVSCTPFGAGALLQGPPDSQGDTQKCTIGLIARKGNEIGVLTAAHCVPSNGSTMSLGAINTNWVGTAENRTLNDSSGLDYVFLSLGNYQTDNRHNTLANTVYSTNNRQLDMAVNTRNAQVGDMICNAGWGTEDHYGAASADRCGDLDHRGASNGYAVSDDMESCTGNSGGAVTYRNSSASSIYIVGLVEGSSGGTFGSNPTCSNGSKFTEVARALSGAGATRHAVSTKQRTVQTFYDRMLNRVPDSGGYNWYDQYLGYACDTADLGVISYGMAVSPEVTNNPSLTVDTATGRYLRLERLYRTMLRRQPDNAGLAAYDSYIYGNFYSSTAARETRWAAVASGMRGTSEFTTAAQSTTRRYAEPGMCKLAVP